MSLTPEERKRIYEEEKARLEAQEKLRKEQPPPKKRGFLAGCLMVIGGFFVLTIVISAVIASLSGTHTQRTSTTPSSTTPSPTTPEKLKGHLFIRLTKWQYNDFAHWIEAEGKVTNDGPVAVFSPEVIGEAYDKSGTLLGQSSAWPAGQTLSNMDPGVAAGFSMLIPVKGGTIANARVYTKSAPFDVAYPKR